MRLSGQISVSLDVNSFAEAGDHQRALEEFLDAVRTKYPDAALTLKQRRERAQLQLAPAPKPRGFNGGRRA